MRLTDRLIASLPFSENGQKYQGDDAVPGFGVRVGSRSKTFVLTLGAERRRVTIGRYPIVSLSQAREKARTLLANRQLGLDQGPPPTPFFKELLKPFLKERENRLRHSTVLKDGYTVKLFNRFLDTRIADISPDMVQGLLDEQAASWTRHYCLRLFVAFVKYAQKRGHLDDWPLHRLDAPLVSVPRERVLTDDELRKVLAAARVWSAAGHQFGTICELLILTGQRRQQIGSLDRAHVDFDTNTINWPADLMKSKRRHSIPMGTAVRAILEARQANGLYFPNMYGYPFSAWSVWYQRFIKDLDIPHFTLHDFRRGFATTLQRLDIPIATTEKLLSHSTITGGLVGIYQRHNYLKEMRSAVETYEEWLRQLMI